MLILYIILIDTPDQKEKAEQLYRRYRKLMKYIALQILEREDLAEDAVHDAMLRLIENLHCVGAVNSEETKGFIAIVTQNIAIDLLRKEKRFSAENIHDHLHKLQARNSLIEKVYVDELLLKICNMPQALRDPLELSLYYGLNSRQIAKILDLSDAAVRKRLQRARAYLEHGKERICDEV